MITQCHNDILDAHVSLLESEEKSFIPGLQFTNRAVEKTRLFILRAYWSLRFQYLQSDVTPALATLLFSYLLQSWAKETNFETDFTDCQSTRDTFWLCGVSAIRIAIKMEERPMIAYQLLASKHPLMEFIPLARDMKLQDIVAFENKANLRLSDRILAVPATMFLQTLLPILGLQGPQAKIVMERASFIIALSSFSQEISRYPPSYIATSVVTLLLSNDSQFKESLHLITDILLEPSGSDETLFQHSKQQIKHIWSNRPRESMILRRVFRHLGV